MRGLVGARLGTDATGESAGVPTPVHSGDCDGVNRGVGAGVGVGFYDSRDSVEVTDILTVAVAAV